MSNRYTILCMIDETTFRHESDKALESLKQSLFRAEEAGGFETDEKNGVLNVLFEVRLHSKYPCSTGLDLCAFHVLQIGMG
jgi:hypothetical protein